MSSTDPREPSKDTRAEAPEAGGGNPRQMPMVVYILYLVSFVTAITALVGVVLAYVNRNDAPAWVQSHYAFQIRTFWWSLLAVVVGSLLSVFGIGLLILFAWMVWMIVRCAVGLSRLNENRPIDHPESLWTGR